MNETASDHRAKESARLPIKLILWTVFTIAVIWLLHSNIGQLNDRFNIDTATPTIAGVVLLFLTWLLWLGWSMFRLGSLLVTIVVFAMPISFLSLYYIDFDGDIQVTFRPRFWNWKSENYLTVDEGTVSGIDLVTTTDYDSTSSSDQIVV